MRNIDVHTQYAHTKHTYITVIYTHDHRKRFTFIALYSINPAPLFSWFTFQWGPLNSEQPIRRHFSFITWLIRGCCSPFRYICLICFPLWLLLISDSFPGISGIRPDLLLGLFLFWNFIHLHYHINKNPITMTMEITICRTRNTNQFFNCGLMILFLVHNKNLFPERIVVKFPCVVQKNNPNG